MKNGENSLKGHDRRVSEREGLVSEEGKRRKYRAELEVES
jgi:hypothetical protein